MELEHLPPERLISHLTNQSSQRKLFVQIDQKWIRMLVPNDLSCYVRLQVRLMSIIVYRYFYESIAFLPLKLNYIKQHILLYSIHLY